MHSGATETLTEILAIAEVVVDRNHYERSWRYVWMQESGSDSWQVLRMFELRHVPGLSLSKPDQYSLSSTRTASTHHDVFYIV